ncbi:carbohydrate binding domain-containing protein, partial [Pseudomonas asplenii]|uniref:carbohydrate binding domain-containing protein n=2 Tax=Pseudomonas asplenii TaxID=53407 RepID=UPI00028A3A5D
KVAFGGSSNEAEAQVFPTQGYTISTPLRQLTDFEDDTTGLWTRGKGAADSTFETVSGSRVLRCPTIQADNGSLVLSQVINLFAKTQYRLSCKARRYQTLDLPPRLYFTMNHGTFLRPVTITGTAWQTLSAVFTPTSSSTILDIRNEEYRPAGNDFDIDDVLIEQIT